MKLSPNDFLLKKRPKWRLFLYHVDMLPEVDYTKEPKYHAQQNQSMDKKYFFNGTILITVHPIPAGNLVFSS